MSAGRRVNLPTVSGGRVLARSLDEKDFAIIRDWDGHLVIGPAGDEYLVSTG